MSRTDHAGWDPKLRRRDPLKLLEESVRGRVPSLVELKYERMCASPFGYYRGAVPVMAYDLSLSPHTSITNQLCGDAHVSNLGAFAGLDGRVVFDINDFDETIVGPFEWDVKRMATSLILAGRFAGAKEVHCEEAAAVFLDSYRRTMLEFAKMPVLDVARHQVHRLKEESPISAIFSVAQRATPLHNLQALTVAVKEMSSAKKQSGAKAAGGKPAKNTPAQAGALIANPQRIFKTMEPVLTRVTGRQAQLVVDSLASYKASLLPERRHFLAQYTPIDVAFKVVGTGSVGLRDYCIYMQGNGPGDPLFLQIKEETHSGYSAYLPKVAAGSNHQGRRVVEGERAMQLQSDPFLGWTVIEGRDYLVRQLNDHKASVDLTGLNTEGLLEYAGVCGEMLARGHARSGDPIMLAGYIGTSARFDDAITRFALQYADQTDHDWKHLVHSRKGSAAPAKKASPKAAKKKG